MILCWRFNWVLVIVSVLVFWGCSDSHSGQSSDGDIKQDGDLSESDTDIERLESENDEEVNPASCNSGEIACFDNNVVVCNDKTGNWKVVADCSLIGYCFDGECRRESPGNGDEDLDISDGDKTESDENFEEVDVDEESVLDGDTDLDEYDSETDGDSEAELDEYESLEDMYPENPYCVNDGFGENHHYQSAAPLNLPVLQNNLLLCNRWPDWFSFPISAGHGIDVRVTTGPNEQDADVYLYTDPSWPYDYLAAAFTLAEEDRLVYNATESALYYLKVEAFESTAYDLSINYSTTGFHIPGDDCSDPLDFEVNNVYYGYLDQQSPQLLSSCSTAYGKDVVFRFELPETKRLRIDLYSEFDGAFSIRTTCNDPSSEILCRDMLFVGGTETVGTEQLASGVYYLIVDSADATGVGEFTLRVYYL